ncbi:MAG: ornithine cyclodeaminase family protein [Acidimicrobiia bacterium]|nr:ornithine cyclodeaminase family protein [Acidimicrobiia bacterium]
MVKVRVLTAHDVAGLLDPVALRTALEEAMDGLSAGRAQVPPRVAAQTPQGWLGAMPGYIEGVGLAAKLVTVFAGNTDVPSHQGLIALFDEATGTPLSIMDAEVITERRTAGTAAIAADLLARPDAEVLTIVGAGAQAAGHAMAFAPLRPWREVRVVNRSQPAAVVVAGRARAAGLENVEVFADFEPAVTGADLVALCTHADEGVIDAGWVGTGTHVSSVGSAAELPAELARADVVVVEWRDAVTTPPPAGAAELQSLGRDDVIELGDLIAERSAGRTSPQQVTVYKSTGHAVQDVAAARLVHDAAVAADVGTEIEL